MCVCVCVCVCVFIYRVHDRISLRHSAPLTTIVGTHDEICLLI